jgi:hypothetical protein
VPALGRAAPHPEQKELTVAEALELERSGLAADAGAVRRLPRDRACRDRHLPDQLRPQPLLGHGQGGAAGRAGPRLCRPHRRAPAATRSSPSMPGTSAATGRSTIPGITCRCWPTSPAPAERRALPGLGPAAGAARLRRKLGSGDDADRRFVRVLAAVLTDGLEAVEARPRSAGAGTASDEVILNILARYREPPRAADDRHVRGSQAQPSPDRRLRPLRPVRGLDAAA